MIGDGGTALTTGKEVSGGNFRERIRDTSCEFNEGNVSNLSSFALTNFVLTSYFCKAPTVQSQLNVRNFRQSRTKVDMCISCWG